MTTVQGATHVRAEGACSRYAHNLHNHRCRPLLGPHGGRQVRVPPTPAMGTIGGGGSRHRRGEQRVMAAACGTWCLELSSKGKVRDDRWGPRVYEWREAKWQGYFGLYKNMIGYRWVQVAHGCTKWHISCFKRIIIVPTLLDEK